MTYIMRYVAITACISLLFLPQLARSVCADYDDSPSRLGGVQFWDWAYGVAAVGEYVYVANFYHGLAIVDVTNLHSPEIIGRVDTRGCALEVTVRDGYAYVADRGWGVQVVDVSDPTNPEIVSTVGGVGVAYEVALQGNHAYLAAWSRGLTVIDVSDPLNPILVGAVDTPGHAMGIDVRDEYVYLADREGGFRVIDITNSSAPLVVGIVTDIRAVHVAIDGRYAYVAAYYDGLAVIDISTPSAPAIVAGLDTPSAVVKVAKSGDHVYLIDRESGVHVIDVSNPLSPSLVGVGHNATGDSHGLDVADEYICVGGRYGISVFPVQCSVSGMLTELMETVQALALPDGLEQAFLVKIDAARHAADGGNDDAANGQLNAFVHQVDAQRGRHIDDDDADMLIASAEIIMAMLDTSGGPFAGGGKWRPVHKTPTDTIGGLQLSASHPNPFGWSTTISFALPQPSPVSIGIYDVAGRLVRVLIDDERLQGRQLITWDGRDRTGLWVSGGTYFVKLTAGDVTRTRKVVFLGGQ